MKCTIMYTKVTYIIGRYIIFEKLMARQSRGKCVDIDDDNGKSGNFKNRELIEYVNDEGERREG